MFLETQEISNGKTLFLPIRSVITQVIGNSDDRVAGVLSVCHEYDYRPSWTI